MQKKVILTSSEVEYNCIIKVVSHLELGDSTEFRTYSSSIYPEWPCKSYEMSVRESFPEVQGIQKMKLIIHLHGIERESRPRIIVGYSHIDPLKDVLYPVPTVAATRYVVQKQHY